MKHKLFSHQIIKFIIIGVCAVIIDFTVYKILQSIGVDIHIAKYISYAVGALFGYFLNKFWTFENNKKSIKQVVLFIALYACSALLNTGVNTLSIFVLNEKFIAFMIATTISTIANYLGMKFIVFEE